MDEFINRNFGWLDKINTELNLGLELQHKNLAENKRNEDVKKIETGNLIVSLTADDLSDDPIDFIDTGDLTNNVLLTSDSDDGESSLSVLANSAIAFRQKWKQSINQK
ncbi:hypothetical protein GPJ56_009762 [Histomonas meleagridis]|uniref:uncharacterized protein n=1 Tax=Histomonas meleagridis TaxID=135588 RepID=UPI00355937E8|nr:hypothetical protein GPJ56_009762 [Histomonas meleagridis]KAH0802323.1 hypothetical protein GO595_004936 [Histomonas meleagridis]